MKPAQFHEDAQAELDESIGFYEARLPGLGVDLRREAESATGKILESPQAWPPFSKRPRRYIIRRFPYSVVYFEERDRILIVAVAHHKRRSGYWHGRL